MTTTLACRRHSVISRYGNRIHIVTLYRRTNKNISVDLINFGTLTTYNSIKRAAVCHVEHPPSVRVV